MRKCTKSMPTRRQLLAWCTWPARPSRVLPILRFWPWCDCCLLASRHVTSLCACCLLCLCLSPAIHTLDASLPLPMPLLLLLLLLFLLAGSML